MSLKNKALSGIKWTTFSTIIVTLFQFLQLAILTRFLEPSDFGLMALVMVVIGFSQAFLDMGISNAIIQKQNITQQQLSTLYWLNVLSGVILFGIIIISASLIADLYKEPELTPLIIIVGLTFVIQPFGMQFIVLWQKDLKFNDIAITDIISKFFSLIISVFLAYKGYGVYALVYGSLFGTICKTSIFIYKGLKIYQPSFVFKLKDINGFLSFGLYQMGEKSINYMSANIDKILIGKFIGMEALGFYNLAWQLIIFPVAKINPIVNRVAFPVYVKVQNNRLKLSHYYEKSMKGLALFTIPLLTYIFFYSSDIVFIFYGKGWELSAELVSILAFVGLLKVIGNPGGALLLALGRADIGFWWNLFWIILVTIVLFIMISLMPDILVVAHSLLVLSLSTSLIFHRIIYNVSQVKYYSITQFIIKIMILSFIIAYLSVEGINILNVNNSVLRILFSSIICISLYGAYLWKFEQSKLNLFFNKGIK